MPIKKIDEITDKQIKDNGVQALADRPNLPNQYGASGLSASQLKAWFDKLATFLAHRINEITNALSSEDAASYIRVQLDEYDVDNLGDLITAFSNGGFASKILKVYPDAGATETTSLQSLLSIIAQTLSEQSSKIYSIETNISDKFNSIVDLSSEQTIDGVKYFTGFNYFGRVDELEGNTSIVGSDILIRTDDKLSWYRGDYIMFYSAGLTTWTRYDNGVISHCYLPPEGGLPITIDLAIPKGESYNRTIATREWVEEQGFADSDALGGKVAKFTGDLGNTNRVYGITNTGAETTFKAVYPPTGGPAIPLFDGNKCISTYTPISDTNCANKKYVDEAVANVKLYRHNIVFYHTDASNVVHTIRLEYISKKSTAYTSVVEFANEFTENYNGVVSYNGGFGNGACQLVIDKTVGFGFNVNGVAFSMGNVKGVYISVYGEQLIASQITITDTVTEI